MSIVLSSQVGNGLTATAVSKDTLESNPISLTFNLISVCCYSCCSVFIVYYGLYIFAGKWNDQIQVCVLEFFWTVSCNSYNLICVSQLNLTRTLCYSLYSVGSGSWVTDGISTTRNMTVGNVTSVQCQSTHLTSFAVLVDVAGGLQVCVWCQMWQNIVTYGFVFWLPICFVLAGYTRSGAQSLTDCFIHWMCHLYILPYYCCTVLHNARVWLEKKKT